MIRSWLILGLALFFTANHGAATAAEDGWKMPRILPFPPKQAQPARPPAPPKFSPPSMIRPVSAIVPDSLDFTHRHGNQPSPWDRLATGTKQLHHQTTEAISSGAKKVSDDTKAILTKSKQLLMPWSEDQTASTRRRGSGRGPSSHPGGGGLLSLPKWWTTESRPARAEPITMSDWLGQPRPGD